MTNESIPNPADQSFVNQSLVAIPLTLQYPCSVLTGYWQDRQDERERVDRLRQLGKAALDPAFNDSDLIGLQREADQAVRDVERLSMSIAEIDGAAMPDDPEARDGEERKRKAQVVPLRQQLAQSQAAADEACSRLGEIVFERAPQHPAIVETLRACLEGNENHALRRARRSELSETWNGLPISARALGITANCLVLLVLGIVGWTVFGPGDPSPSNNERANVVDGPTPDSNGGKGTSSSSSDKQQGTDDKRATEPETGTATLPDHDSRSATVDSALQVSVPQRIRRQFRGKILSSTETYRHQYQVSPPFDPIDLQLEARHLGDNKIDRWERAAADGRDLKIEFDLPQIPDCLVHLSCELFQVEYDNPIFLNGKSLGFLPKQNAERYKPFSVRVPRSGLRTGKNELHITVVNDNDDNFDDLLIRNVRLLPGPALVRVQLSRVPGVDGRLACYHVAPDGARQQVFLLNESQEAEEVFPNWAPLAGNYEFEIQADGANPDVEYMLDVQSDGFVTEQEEHEPNDVGKSATRVNVNQTLRGYVSRAGDRDFYRFDVQQRAFLSAQLREVPETNLVLQLLDSRLSVTKTFDAGAVGEGEQTDLLELEPGIWYLAVSSAGTNVDFPYRLSLKGVAGRQSYASEPNDNKSQAIEVTAGTSIRGTLNPPGEEDWFHFSVEAPDKSDEKDPRHIVRLRVSPLDGVQLQAKLDNAYAWLPAGGIGAEYKWTNWVVAPGNHTIALRGHRQGRVDIGQEYRLRVDLLNIDQADDGYSVGNNSLETRLSQTPRDAFRSALYPWEKEDYYELHIEDDGIVYRLREDRPFLDSLGIEIRDLDQNVLKRIGPTTLRNWSPAPGRYVLRVFRHDNAERHVDYGFQFVEDRVWDSDEEREFNDTQETASALTVNNSVAAWFSPHTKDNPDRDWYRIVIPEDGQNSSYAISVKPEGEYLNVRLQLVDAAGQSRVFDAHEIGPEVIENWSPRPGEYYLLCSALGETRKSEPYSIRWERTGTRSELREFEPNNQLTEATPLRLDRLVKGDLESRQDVDMFQVTGGSEPLTVLFKLHGSDRVQEVEILDEQGQVVSPKQTPFGRVLEFHNYLLPPDSLLNVRVVASRNNFTRSGREYSIVASKRGVWYNGVEAEPNGAKWTPNNLTLGTSVSGAIRPETDVDRFLWKVSDGNQLHRLSIQPPEGQKLKVRIDLPLNSDTNWKFLEAEIQNQPLVIPNFRPPIGDVIITLWAPYQKQGKDYRILVEHQSDLLAGHDVEPNHEESSTPLAIGKRFEGGFHSADDRDSYYIDSDGNASYELAISSSGTQPTKVTVASLDDQDQWITHKQFNVGNNDEQIVHAFRPRKGRHTINLNASYGAARYALRLAKSQVAEGTELEPNDRFDDAVPFQVGQSIRGWVDVSNDHDFFKVSIEAPEGQVVRATWKAPEDSPVAWLYRLEGDTTSRDYSVPKGQVLEIDNIWLPKGNHYFGVRRNGGPAQYEFDLQPQGPFESNRGYQTWGSNFGEQPFDESGIMRGRFIPFLTDWDAYSFRLEEPSAVAANLSAIAKTATSLVIKDSQKRVVFVSDIATTGAPELLYLPFLNAGHYYLEARASGVRPEARDYELRMQVAPAGTLFPSPKKEELNVAFYGHGGRIISQTSQYNSGWSAERLIDGGTESRGWSSIDAKLPQEIVIGFLQDRRVRPGRILINPRTSEGTNNWARNVEVLGTKETNSEDWISLGASTLLPEDRYQEIPLADPESIARLKLRIADRNGNGSYTQMGEVRVFEAAGQSSLRDALASPEGTVDFAGGINLLHSRFGTKVVSAASEYDDNWKAQNLLDGYLRTGSGWSSAEIPKEGSFDTDIVLELPVEMPLSALVFSTATSSNWKNRVRDLEVIVTGKGGDKAIRFRLDPSVGWKLFQFPSPISARRIKLRPLGNYGGSYFGLGEVMAFADSEQVATGTVRRPFKARQNIQVPGSIECEDFDEARYEVRVSNSADSASSTDQVILTSNTSAGYAFYDRTPNDRGNTGGKYRQTPVDLYLDASASNGHCVAYVNAGEWLDYSIDVANPGAYTFEVVFASNLKGARFHLEVDGVDRTGPIVTEKKGREWRTVSIPGIDLTTGRHVLRLFADKSGEGSEYVSNFDVIRIKAEN